MPATMQINKRLVYDFGTGPMNFVVDRFDEYDETLPHHVIAVDDEGRRNSELQFWAGPDFTVLACGSAYRPLGTHEAAEDAPKPPRAPDDNYPPGTKFILRRNDGVECLYIVEENDGSPTLPHYVRPLEKETGFPALWLGRGLVPSEALSELFTFVRLV